MKHLHFKSIGKYAAALLLGASALLPARGAELLLDENFDYPLGNLYNQGGWVKYASNPEAPIQVIANSLTYAGYMDESVGGKVELVKTVSGEDLHKALTEKVGEGSIYASFLLNVKDPNDAKAYFFSLLAETAKGAIGLDGKSPSEYGKVYVCAGSDAEHFKMAVSRNGAFSKAVQSTAEFNVGETYLIVLKYEIIEGNSNDKFQLWVNPTPGAAPNTDPTVEVASGSSEGDVSTSAGGFGGVQLRQGGGSYNAPDLVLDVLRVSTDYADLFGSSGPVTPVDTPVISVSNREFNMDQVLEGMSFEYPVVVKAQNLKGDITITCPADVTCDKTSITKEEAESEDGATVKFTVTAKGSEEFVRTVTLASEEADNVEIKFSGWITPCVSIVNSTQIESQFSDPEFESKMYRYTGKAVVTYIESAEMDGYPYYRIYAQDMFGGLCISTVYCDLETPGIAVGDEITDVVCFLEKLQGAPVLDAMDLLGTGSFCTVLSNGKSKTPTDIRIGEITSATAPEYIYRLVKVSDVSFVDAEGKTFEANKNYNITDGEKTAVVRIFSGSDLIGQPVPTEKLSVTGISRSTTQLTLGVGYASWLVAPGEVSVTITPKRIFDFTSDAAPIGSETEIYEFTVAAENLPEAAPVTLTGADFAAFKAVPAEIPAGTSNTVVKIYYCPEKIGRHSGGVFFDFDKINPEYNYSVQFQNCKAYDPENLPKITIEPASLELIAAPGETAKGTVTLNAENCFDYITGKRLGEGQNGGITINNTYLLPDSRDVVLEVTFAPKAEGNFEETFVYSTTKCSAPAELKVTAVCKGSVDPEPTEGQDFELSDANPRAWYVQKFDGLENNKPLFIEGWVNSALEGTRAWWGYNVEEEGETIGVAKVTAYDSKVETGAGTPCQMVLVTPPLSYKDAENKHLKFRLMGRFLTEKSGDKLEICFVEKGPEGTYELYPMDGFDIPAKPEEADTWIPYDVDMSAVPDMPDTFFIAFRFTGTRGIDNATTYYITDFEWSQEPSGIGSVAGESNGFAADQDGVYRVYNTSGALVLATRDASALRHLPAGIYVSAGRKVAVIR